MYKEMLDISMESFYYPQQQIWTSDLINFLSVRIKIRMFGYLKIKACDLNGGRLNEKANVLMNWSKRQYFVIDNQRDYI